MHETAIDLLEACANQTLAERFQFSLGTDIPRHEFLCSFDVEVGELVYLDDNGEIRPVRGDECSSYLAVCMDRNGDTASVATLGGILVRLPYEGKEPEVNEVVYAAGRFVKGTVSTERPPEPVYQVGRVLEAPEKGYVLVEFRPTTL